MGYHLLKAVEEKRQHNSFSTSEIVNWSLPSWFLKQNDPLNPGYGFGGYRFANLCYRNWTTFYNESGKEVLVVDGEGTISFPQIGVSVEVWVNDGKTLFTPGRFLRTEQKAAPDFPCIETKSFFQSGYYNNRIFTINGYQNEYIGIEFEFYPNLRNIISEVLFFLVVRPYDHNGISAINRLEYKNHYIKVNNNNLLQFQAEPIIVFCTQAGFGDVTEYFKLDRNNESISSIAGNCTAAIGYGIRSNERSIIKFCYRKESQRLFFKKDPNFTKEWLFDSKQKWISRYSFQHHMISADNKINYIYHTNLNYFIMFSGGFSKWDDVYRILVLNRLALYSISRAYLLKALKKVRWDGSFPSSKELTPEKLIYAIADYYRLSGDLKLVKDNWQVIKRIGFWLIQNKKPVTYDLNLNCNLNLGWVCASFKGLSKLSEINGSFEDYQFFQEQFQELWTQILGFFSRKFKEYAQDGFQRDIVISEAIGGLSLSFPLQLYPRDERFIREWLSQVIRTSTFKGGVVSPIEFLGVDLEMTARLGSILLRQGLQYDSAFKFLINTISPTGSWSDRIHPVFGRGMGVTGHAPKVCCQFLLLLRNIMVMEEEEILYLLPGILNSFYWHYPNIELKNVPTTFGEISLRCRSVGQIIQINYHANYRIRPQQIRLLLNQNDRLLFSDSVIKQAEKYIDLGPDFKITRLRRGTILSMS